MKLVAFSVHNYRSIVEAYKLSLGNYTVLVGPNNEGKSNIVKAIALSLGVLTKSRPYRRARRVVRYYRSEFRFNYDWPMDFPVSLQDRYPDGRSWFTLEFALTDDDFTKFRETVGVNLTTNLKIKLGFGPEDASFEVLMKGRGKKNLNSKREEISRFIRKHVSSQYISALRPSEMAIDLVDGLIESELSALESDPDYERLIIDLQNLQKPILDKIADKLKTTVSDFVPGVRGVRITNELGSAFRTNFNILVDDGAETALASKGDGIISLTTMSLMKHVSEESIGEESLILSIEEPESHLHPEAIHGLRQVLKDISKRQQVIITTHSPILVEREQVTQNILVRDGRAARARHISDIRNALGIQMGDNLIGSYAVLLVEGEEDRDLLLSWLAAISPQLKSALSRRILVIDHLGGATNLHYKVTFYKQNVFNIHAFMDNDDDGRKSIQNAIDKNVLDPADYNLATCQGMQNSEIEDLVNIDTYAASVNLKFGVNLNQPRFRNTRSKWSDRAAKMFQLSGKIWNKAEKIKVKRFITDACVAQGVTSLNEHKSVPIKTLVESLEAKLAVRGT
ncbi:MAG: AAA family ATPase [Sedimentisphaerales bacterium]|nr:AAA family ATPase [Sedimentisphaerales bacterium]